MNVGELMTTDVITCSPNDSIASVAQKLKQENIGSCPVVWNDRVVGIVTDRDITIRAVARGLDPSNTNVDQIMSKDLITAEQFMDIEDAAELMANEQIRRLLVVDNQGMLLGIIAQADLAIDLEEEEMLAHVIGKISEPSHTHSQ